MELCRASAFAWRPVPRRGPQVPDRRPWGCSVETVGLAAARSWAVRHRGGRIRDIRGKHHPFDAAPSAPAYLTCPTGVAIIAGREELGGSQGMIDKELLEILACPVCKSQVTLQDERIVCCSCGRRYPIRDGIPVMMASEAEPPRQPEKPQE